MEIGAWLRGLSLERYEASFRDNDIDADVLPDLTTDDLIGPNTGWRGRCGLHPLQQRSQARPNPSPLSLTWYFCLYGGRLDRAHI